MRAILRGTEALFIRVTSVIDNGEVHSERQRAKGWAEAASRGQGSSELEDSVEEKCRMGAEAASNFVCSLPSMLNL